MFNPVEIRKQLFRISSPEMFNETALEIFHFQVLNCEVYQLFVNNLGIDPDRIDHFEQIPFMPVEFFKQHRIYATESEPQAVFSSSGTSGGLERAHHYVANLSLYEESFLGGFRQFYGDPGQYLILALLPSYLERDGSSLVYMVEKLIELSGHPGSGFYLHDHKALLQTIHQYTGGEKKILLFGVTFALLDLAEKSREDLQDIIVIETGGMKGRKKEMVREEVHKLLAKNLGVQKIHSEYGMTELLSQAYSAGDGLFYSPPWMKVMIRDVNDPLAPAGYDETGGINVIDLANLWSCSFIATQDLGKMYEDGSFEVLGRFDHSDVRGCNLLVV